MNAEALWAEGQDFYTRHLAFAALDRFLLLAQVPEADLARAWNAAGLAAMKLRDFTAAERYLKLSLAQARTQGAARSMLRALVNLILLHTRTAQVDKALSCTGEAGALYSLVEDPYLRSSGLMHSALAYELSQRWEDAIACTLQAMEGTPPPTVSAWLHNNLGVYLHETGRLDEARTSLLTALEQALRTENAAVVAHACTEMARLSLRLGDWTGAVGYGRQAIDYLWNHMIDVDKGEVARLCEVFGRLALAMDDRRRGSALLERTSTYYAQLGLWREWSRVTEMLRSGGVGRLVKPSDLPADTHSILQYFTDLFGLLDNIESTDTQLSNRGHLITHYALLLGSAMGFDQEQIRLLSHAGRFCDIGLTTFEPEAIADESGHRYRLHPEISARWLEDFPLPPGTGQVVRAHHERFDGSGFPDGLVGEQIPLSARVLAVCEAYIRAMQSGTSHDDAIALLARESGAALDPGVVEAFTEHHQPPR